MGVSADLVELAGAIVAATVAALVFVRKLARDVRKDDASSSAD